MVMVPHYSVEPAALVTLHAPDRVGDIYRIPPKQRITLGREEYKELASDHTVSRRHCTIEWSDEGALVVDCCSAHGTIVNQCAIDRATLRRSDRLYIGRHVLEYLDGANLRRDLGRTLTRLATRDGLTGLLNARAWMGRLHALAEDLSTERRSAAVIRVDVRNLDAIERDYGPYAVNVVREVVAERLQSCVASDESIARVSSDVFFALVANAGQRFAAIADATRSLEPIVRLGTGDEAISVRVELSQAPCRSRTDIEDVRAQHERLCEPSLRPTMYVASSVRYVPFALALIAELRRQRTHAQLLVAEPGSNSFDRRLLFPLARCSWSLVVLCSADTLLAFRAEIEAARMSESMHSGVRLQLIALDKAELAACRTLGAPFEQALRSREPLDGSAAGFGAVGVYTWTQRLLRGTVIGAHDFSATSAGR